MKKLRIRNILCMTLALILLTACMIAPASAAAQTFPAPKTNSGSIVDCLKSVASEVGKDWSSFADRKLIAAELGWKSYSGTMNENETLVRLMRSNQLPIPGSNTSKKTEKTVKIIVITKNNSPARTGYYEKYKASAYLSKGAEYTYIKQHKNLYGNTWYQISVNGKKLWIYSGNCKVVTKKVDTEYSAILVDANANLSVSRRWIENGIKYKSVEGQRSAKAYNTVIDQYFVNTNSRHAKSGGNTWCNIFLWDVTRAMGAEIPHWVKNNAPVASCSSGAWEMNANATVNWLRDCGAKYGWTRVTAAQAQARANQGYPTVVVWKNSGGSGHVAIVRPEANGYTYSAAKGPVIAQAGGSCFNYGNVSTGFGSNRLDSVVYYTHD